MTIHILLFHRRAARIAQPQGKDRVKHIYDVKSTFFGAKADFRWSKEQILNSHKPIKTFDCFRFDPGFCEDLFL